MKSPPLLVGAYILSMSLPLERNPGLPALALHFISGLFMGTRRVYSNHLQKQRNSQLLTPSCNFQDTR